MRRCGKRYSGEEEALRSKRGLTGLYEAVRCRSGCGGVHLKKRQPQKVTGFSAAVKLQIRTRAGNGDPAAACCEACAVFLGEHGGQVQHIYARQAGGSLEWLYRSAANGALLCGTVYTGDHGLCEDRDPHMEAMGFWRRRNGQEKPGDYPIMLHGEFGGVQVYLTPDGGYSLQAPRAGAA